MLRTSGRNIPAALAAVLCVAGCAHKPPRVDCDGKLQPINLPAPLQGETTAPVPSNEKHPVRITAPEAPGAESNSETDYGPASPDQREKSP